jgi:Ca2+-transporting ATPase
MAPDTVLQNPHSSEVRHLLGNLQVDARSGLTDTQWEERSQRYGLNKMQAKAGASWVKILGQQFTSPIIWLLAGAGAVSFYFGDLLEGVAILMVILINAALGFIMEWQAIRSVAALRQMDVQLAKVYRNGTLREVPSEDITIGDIFFVEAGDLIPADGRVIEANQSDIDESPLTGESLPVTKNTGVLEVNTPLAERTNMLYKGTAVLKGNARAVVTGVAAGTELGKITSLVESAEQSATPLEQKMTSLTKVLIWITVAIAALFILVGLLRGEDWVLIVETAIALAVAAIPEGLSIVATIALASGMLRLAKRNAVIRKLTAVETLGGTNVIFTDKTGTLTENKIFVNTFLLEDLTTQADDSRLRGRIDYQQAVRIGALCNNAQLHTENGEEKAVGDPLEIALLHFAGSGGVDLMQLKDEFSRVAEIPFNSDTKMMGTLHRDGPGYWVAAKGALESVLPECTHVVAGNEAKPLSPALLDDWNRRAEDLQAEGLRVLAFAYRELKDEPREENWLHNLVLTGIIGFLDPPRMEVKEALQSCRDAGIKVIMITGDHPATALHIAKRVGLVPESETLVINGNDFGDFQANGKARKEFLDASVFARVTPKQKLDAVSIYQGRGQIVAMTGDGINDAPALKKADIGIAMGLRGTQVAKETADMVLKDDSFTSIAAAIAQGRAIFRNIKYFITFLFACNLSEVFITALYAFSGLPFILLPLQILFINLITDVLPALALGMSKGNKLLMKDKPRNPQEPILNRKDWQSVFSYAIIITLCIAGCVIYGNARLGWDDRTANTVTVISLALAQLWHVFNLPGRNVSFFRNEVTGNGYVWAAVVLCLAIILIFTQVTFLREILQFRPVDARILGVSLLISLIPLPVSQLFKRILKVLP